MKLLGLFDGVTEVMELGAQQAWCYNEATIKNLYKAFDRPAPSSKLLRKFTNRESGGEASGRELYEGLGFRYASIDLNGDFGALKLDINFDDVPEEHRGRYGMVTNHGTTEHLLNQYNAFKMIHELTATDGLMLHAVPFTVHLEHGFFNYQPNFFEALARYNSYRTLGIWLGPDWQQSSFIPWHRDLLDYMVLSSNTTHLLVVLQQKMYDTPFCVPWQEVYQGTAPDDAMDRYCFVVDGHLLDGSRYTHLTTPQSYIPPLEKYSGRELLKALAQRIKRRLTGNLPPE